MKHEYASPKIKCLHFEHSFGSISMKWRWSPEKRVYSRFLFRSWLKRSHFNEIWWVYLYIDIKTEFWYCHWSVLEVSSNSTVDWFIQDLRLKIVLERNERTLTFFRINFDVVCEDVQSIYCDLCDILWLCCWSGCITSQIVYCFK